MDKSIFNFPHNWSKFLCWLNQKPENHRNGETSPPPAAGPKSSQDNSISAFPNASPRTSDTSSTHCSCAETTSNTSDPNFDLESNVFLYRDTYFRRLATIFSTLISSLIPIVAIIVLSFVKNMTARLGIVCAFTAVFSVCLSLMTEAKRVENFAATAAWVILFFLVLQDGKSIGIRRQEREKIN